MAWIAPRTWVVGEVVTAALLNGQIRDNLLESIAGKATTAGDMAYATGASALTRLPLGDANSIVRVRSGVPKWVVPGLLGHSWRDYATETSFTPTSSTQLQDVELDGTAVSVTFIPLTTAVLVRISGFVDPLTIANGIYTYCGLREGSSDVSGTKNKLGGRRCHSTWTVKVSGLTAGVQKTYKFAAHNNDGTNTVTIRAGGSYGGVLMSVWEA